MDPRILLTESERVHAATVAHIADLVSAMGVTLEYMPIDSASASTEGLAGAAEALGKDLNYLTQFQSSAHMITMKIRAQVMPNDEGWNLTRYAVMLHELGHLATGPSELTAWEWALENTILWDRVMQDALELGLMSYHLNCQDDTCYNQTSALQLMDQGEAMIGWDQNKPEA
jgi:hypothetical protein